MSEADRLHQKDEPRFVPGNLYSMLDMVGAEMICDVCGAWQRIPELIESMARQAALKLGWVSRDGKDLCRHCARQ